MDLEGQRTQGQIDPRYEDITQDGRVRIDAFPVGFGLVWRQIRVSPQIRHALRENGIIPILTRFELEGLPGPFAVERAIEVEGGYTLSRSEDEAGRVTRLFLDMDVELWGSKGRTNLPPPDDAGARALVGRAWAEHTFTRPFAPPSDRKVIALPVDGKDFVPTARRAWKPPRAAMDLPFGARALEPALTEDPVSTAFGLSHTDSNQHVNSLVYPRLFEEASLRRLAALGRDTTVLARRLDIAYRRPSFAGEKVKVALRAFELEGRLVCTGAFFGEGESDVERARVYAQMTFE